MSSYSDVAIRLEKNDAELLKAKFKMLPENAQYFLEEGLKEGEKTFGTYKDFVILAWPKTKWYYPNSTSVKWIMDFIYDIRDNTDHWFDYIRLGEEPCDDEYLWNGDQYFYIAKSIEVL